MGRIRGGARSVVLVVLAAVVGIGLMTDRALAQDNPIQKVEPYWAITQLDGATIRCGSADVYYSVRTLKKGSLLRVDGEKSDWVRVQYLPGMVALVKPEVATEIDAGSAIRLNVTSRLQAADEKRGEKRSWQFLLTDSTGLPAGTKLAVKETLRNEAGDIYGYLVPAPTQARGFVRSAFVRKATEQEIEAYLRELGVDGVTEDVAEADGAAAEPITSTDDAETATPVDPRVPADDGAIDAPELIDDATPADPDAASDTDAEATPTPEIKPLTLDEKWKVRIATVEHLQRVYAGVMAQPIATAEVDAAIAEFDRSITAMGKTETDQRLARDLSGRRKVLEVRRDLQRSLRELENSRESLDSLEREVSEQRRLNAAALSYDVVGRLTPSVVYDGRSLPKLYRIEAGEFGAARTVAYVLPTEGIEFSPLIGRTVGIRGEVREDSGLGVRLVRPKAVEGLVPGR